MPRITTPKNTPISKPHNLTNMNPIDEAIEELNSQDPDAPSCQAEIALKHGVEPSTLSRRYRGETTSKQASAAARRLLSPIQETELLGQIKRLTSNGLPPTKIMIGNFASGIAGRDVGKHWVERFISRNADELILTWSSGIDRERYQSDFGHSYKAYFKLLERKIDEYKIEPRFMYNMDEKGFMLGQVHKSKRVFNRQLYQHGDGGKRVQDGSREWITCLAAICADGSRLPPSLIYQSDTESLQDTWLDHFNASKHNAHFTSTLSGWSNNIMGQAWLEQVFDRCTKQKARSSHRLLIVDGHASHLTLPFLDYCEKNRILVAILPPHATHRLQPLDVVMFGPLAHQYSAQVDRFMMNCQAITSMAKSDFWPLFLAAFEASFTPDNILAAFKATGLSPFNPSCVLDRYQPKTPPPRERSRSSEAVDIDAVLVASGPESDVKRAQILARELRRTRARNRLLEQENSGLQQVLDHQDSRRRRGKPLPTDRPDGGALFMSPRAIGRAKDQIAAEKVKKREKRQAMDSRKREREEKQKVNKHLKEQRQIAREATVVARRHQLAQEASEKTARIAARAAQKQLKEAQKMAQKGKQRNTKTPVKQARKQSSGSGDIGGGGQPSVQPEEDTKTSRNGRIIKKPAKYK
jgi:hypothetical protein